MLGCEPAGRGTGPQPVFNHRHGGNAAGAAAQAVAEDKSLSSEQRTGAGLGDLQWSLPT